MVETVGPRAGALRTMDAASCWEAVRTKTVGRIAYCEVTGPVVLPVNYQVHDGAVVFVTAAYGGLAQAMRDRRQVAFQVDEVDELQRTGWSVLISGTARFEAARELPADARPSSWVEGGGPLAIRIETTAISGRRLDPGSRPEPEGDHSARADPIAAADADRRDSLGT